MNYKLIDMKVFGDSRDFFMESYKKTNFITKALKQKKGFNFD